MQNPDLTFCPRCAERLEWRGVEYPDVLHPVCTKCGFILWQNVKPSVDALILRGDASHTEILLGRQSSPRANGKWCIPGGFLNAGDRIEAALIRECRREMCIEIAVGDLVGAFEAMFYDIPMVDLIYVCTIVSGEPRAADLIDDVRWFPLDDLPELALDFEREAIDVLRRKLDARAH
jgi:ADP-ribose pyrophosphatase YjhB (NUDIX family)